MDEAKQLVNMSVAAVFAALFLAAGVALISVGGLLWKSFASQEAANDRVKDYSNYAAYDNQLITGQDAIALINQTLTDEEQFVCIVKADLSANPLLHDAQIDTAFTPVLICNSPRYDGLLTGGAPGGYISDYANEYTGQGILTIDYAINHLKTLTTTAIPKDSSYRYDSLVSDFTRDDLFGNGAGGYAQFYSTVLYDLNSSTDVVGYVLVWVG